MYDTILVPTAGDPGTEQALRYATNEAMCHGAEIHLLTVKDEGANPLNSGSAAESQLEERAQKALQAARQQIPSEIDVDSFTRTGIPKEGILAHVDAYDVDLVVMATNGRTGMQRFLVGSTTESVVRHSDVPVLTIRTPDRK
jgi:nucleotide-binding universal stress UspA family protein